MPPPLRNHCSYTSTYSDWRLVGNHLEASLATKSKTQLGLTKIGIGDTTLSAVGGTLARLEGDRRGDRDKGGDDGEELHFSKDR